MIVESKEAIKVEKTTLDKKFHLISYGCQMNFADSEVVASILESIGYSNTNTIENSDLILLNTCSIREKAEQTIRKKLSSIDHLKKKNSNYINWESNLIWIKKFKTLNKDSRLLELI